MNNKGYSDIAIFLTIGGIALIGAILLGLLSAHMESQTYNKLTGAHTTTWDAMWVELRVQDDPKQDPKN